MENKVIFGLKNVHYAKLNASTEAGKTIYSYDTPKALPGAVSLALTAAGSSSAFFADDIQYFTAFANNGYTGTLEIANTTEDFDINILKLIKDANNNLFENSQTQPAPFALLFEFTGDVKATRHCLYNVVSGRPAINGNTKGEEVTPTTITLDVTATPHPNTLDNRTKTTSASTNYDTWYSAVPMKNEATPANNVSAE